MCSSKVFEASENAVFSASVIPSSVLARAFSSTRLCFVAGKAVLDAGRHGSDVDGGAAAEAGVDAERSDARKAQKRSLRRIANSFCMMCCSVEVDYRYLL